MAIGVFDSGVGGLTVHRALVAAFPQADFVYLADQAHVPYGVREGEEIVSLTRASCARLFQAGCSLVVLACNTASAVALRRLQTEWIPGECERLGRRVNVLGIIVPTIEHVTGVDWHGAAGDAGGAPRSLALFATQATVRSGVFGIEIAKRNRAVSVHPEICLDLARLIETDAPAAELDQTIARHVARVSARIGGAPDQAILGSTHYEVVAPAFRRALPAATEIIRQPSCTVEALGRYLARHPEYAAGESGARAFLTTGRPGLQNGMVEKFWGTKLQFDAA